MREQGLFVRQDHSSLYVLPDPPNLPRLPFFCQYLGSFGEHIRFFYFFFMFCFEHFCQLPFFRQCVYQKDNILLFIYVFPYAQHMSMCFSCSVSTYGLLAGNKTCFFNMQRLPPEGTQRRAEPEL